MPHLIEVSTLGDLLLRAASIQPDRDALVLPDERISYGELAKRALQVARGLSALGIPPRSNIGILVPNSIEFAEALFGIALHGSTAVPLNARHKETELGFIIHNAGLVAVLTSFDARDPVPFPDLLEAALPSMKGNLVTEGLNLPEAPELERLVLLRGEARRGFIDRASFNQGASAIHEEVVIEARSRVRVRDAALIIYTSGTTAHPKGCVLSHEAAVRGPLERARYRLSRGGRDVTWGAGPLFHIGTLAPFVGSVGIAGTYLTDHYFEPGRALALMAEEEVTVAFPWFSAIVQKLIEHPDFDPRKLASLQHLLLIAPRAQVEHIIHLLPQTEIIQGCGMTETAGVFALSDPDENSELRSTTQGKASPGVEVRIVDPNSGLECGAGQVGEIWVRGYNVMDGYWNDPEKTATTLGSDGWLKTGDLYIQLQNGSLVFQGRLKDMLKVGGENVAAIEVEAFLCSHPEVKLAEVVGCPDPRLDEVPVAFVELRAGSLIEPDMLIAYCRGRIASYKVPRAVHIVTEGTWPMSATKVDKNALRRRLTDL